MKKKMGCILTFILFCSIIAVENVTASPGDRSPFYQKCVEKCSVANCSIDGWDFKTTILQPFYLKATLWSCSDECRYNCMWKTVNSFLERSLEVPQFHGRWPFVRLFGLQEPASVFFSFLNLFAHFHMLKVFHQEVRRGSPMFWLWNMYSAVCLNGWFWSCIFHSRDFPFTEKMDYFCAFSMVLFSYYAMCIRIFNGRYKLVTYLLTFLCLLFFVHHVTYLTLVKFDYGYNMKANIVVGVTNAVGWLMWAFFNRKQLPHVWRCALFVSLVGLCMLLEVVDFPPFLWLVDAHSLWHLSTAGLPFIFYRFLIDDCKYLRKQKEMAEESKLHAS